MKEEVETFKKQREINLKTFVTTHVTNLLSKHDIYDTIQKIKENENEPLSEKNIDLESIKKAVKNFENLIKSENSIVPQVDKIVIPTTKATAKRSIFDQLIDSFTLIYESAKNEKSAFKKELIFSFTPEEAKAILFI